jgi:hypothetical protein
VQVPLVKELVELTEKAWPYPCGGATAGPCVRQQARGTPRDGEHSAAAARDARPENARAVALKL